MLIFSSNNKLKQKRTRFSNWKVKSNSIRYVPDVKTYVARYISNINEKIVEKCRAPGKKTGSCAAAEAYAVCKGRRFTVCEANGGTSAKC